MTIQTKQYGTIEVAQDQCIEFPLGIIGFEHLRSFSLIDSDVPHFYILQSLDDINISFFVINPYLIYPTYELEVNDTDLEDIQCTDVEKLLVFSIITIPESKEEISCNLLGPILINKETKLGRQSIALGNWNTKHYFLKDRVETQVSHART